MFIDSSTIKDYLRSIHPNFQEHRDSESKLYYSAPFLKDPHVFLLVFTGINNKFNKTSFLEIRLYDAGQDVFFGRKYIIKFERDWEKKIKKTILWTAKNLDDFTCKICGHYMVARRGALGNFFLGCTNFPECKSTKSIEEIKNFEL